MITEMLGFCMGLSNKLRESHKLIPSLVKQAFRLQVSERLRKRILREMVLNAALNGLGYNSVIFPNGIC
jgi:hypothetical protein